jgi:hypothetical protein
MRNVNYPERSEKITPLIKSQFTFTLMNQHIFSYLNGVVKYYVKP